MPRRVEYPPAIADTQLGRWFDDVASALNDLPPIVSVTDDPEGSTEAEPGTLAVRISDGVASLFLKTSGTGSTGWRQVSTD